MPGDQQQARIEWRDGSVPVSTRFDDPYFSIADGLAETRHVFLDGNDLPARFRPGFTIAELGFGTGLNLLAAWSAWLDHGVDGPLTYVGFEAFPMSPADMEQALAAFPAVARFAKQLVPAWAGAFGAERRIVREGLDATILIGDARETLPKWPGRADAWFLDGFAPARNPELWEPSLMAEVATRTATGGTFATYTAAGDVRRALGAAGFEVTRRAGFGRKRHMSTGVLR